MAHEIVVPRLGWSMDEGTFAGWLKADGDEIQAGEALFSLESDKAVQEIESLDSGILRIPPQGPVMGQVVQVGQIIGYLTAPEETPPWGQSAPNPPSLITNIYTEDSGTSTPARDAALLVRTTSERHSKVASPRARRLALELGVDWQQLTGSGMGGRIRERDVRLAVGPTDVGIKQPISSRRRQIAEKLSASQRQTVPVTLTTRANAIGLIEQRERFKQEGIDPVPSYQDMIIQQLAELLRTHPLLAARWEETHLLVPHQDQLNIGMAVDTAEGLIVPVIKQVPQLSIEQLARNSRELIDRAKAGQLSASDLQGGVFTVTNLGAFGIDAFTPVINYPQTAILGLGAIRHEPTVGTDGRIIVGARITLSLTFDHRVIDGAPAARFLKELVDSLEEPNRKGVSHGFQ